MMDQIRRREVSVLACHLLPLAHHMLQDTVPLTLQASKMLTVEARGAEGFINTSGFCAQRKNKNFTYHWQPHFIQSPDTGCTPTPCKALQRHVGRGLSLWHGKALGLEQPQGEVPTVTKYRNLEQPHTLLTPQHS